MFQRSMQFGFLVLLYVGFLGIGPAYGFERPPAPVPPSLEIAVLDPGVDPLGNPAVIVKDRPKDDCECEDGECQHEEEQVIDIPPTVLVHRYYYTGDRSFQAQLLPGGPCMVVVNHPKTGERCYIPVQMLPGAPRVTYTSHSIRYDYGQNGITISFGIFGCPKVKYRSGIPWRQKVKTLVHAEHFEKHTQDAMANSKEALRRTGAVAYGASVVVKEQADRFVITPARQVLSVMPLGQSLFTGEVLDNLEIRAIEHKQDTQRRKLEKTARRDEASFATIR